MTPNEHRRRYIAYLKEGHTPAEAARRANEEAKLDVPLAESKTVNITLGAVPQPTEPKRVPLADLTLQQPLRRRVLNKPKETATAEPYDEPQRVTTDELDDMPWPELRAMAEEIIGEKVKTRVEAITIISEYRTNQKSNRAEGPAEVKE